MIQRLGTANLLTNAATAAGFATFVITGNKILMEFGILASISILVAYLLTFSWCRSSSAISLPRNRHTRHHREAALSLKIINRVVKIVGEPDARSIYIVSLICSHRWNCRGHPA